MLCAKFIAFFLLMVLLADAALGDLLSGVQNPLLPSDPVPPQNVTNSNGTAPVDSPTGVTQNLPNLEALANCICQFLKSLAAQPTDIKQVLANLPCLQGLPTSGLPPSTDILNQIIACIKGLLTSVTSLLTGATSG